jgi:hypothetical protein
VPLHYSKNSSRASRVSAAAAAAVFLLLSIELESLILLSKTLPTSLNYALVPAPNRIRNWPVIPLNQPKPDSSSSSLLRFYSLAIEIQSQLQALRQQFADELARRDSQIDALSSTITNLQGTVTSLRTATAPRRPKRQLPDPPKFDGTQLHYDTWLAQLQLVLSVDGDAIGDAQAQFAFVYLRLESSPAALCLELLKYANLTKKFDYKQIID